MKHGCTRTAHGRTVLPRRSHGHTALGIALAVAVAGFFVTIAIPAFGLAAEELMPLRPAAPPPALPELVPVRPPEKKTSVRPGPQKNIVRVRIPSPSRYDSETALLLNAAATAIRPPSTNAVRPSATPSAVESPTAVPVSIPSPAPDDPTMIGTVTAASSPVTKPVAAAVAAAPAAPAALAVATPVSAVRDDSRQPLRSAAAVTGSDPAASAHQVRGSLAVPTLILPPVAPGPGDNTVQALIPGLVTPEDLAKPALALQEFNETIERDMADLVDFDSLDATALGSSIAEFLAGPVAPSVAPSALPAMVMHGDEIIQESDRALASGSGGPVLPLPLPASPTEDISAMVPPSMLMGNRMTSGPGMPNRPVPSAKAPSRFDRAASVPAPSARRTPPMAPVTLPPPLSFAQSARPSETRRAAPMPPPPAAALSAMQPAASSALEDRPDSAARLAGFDELLGRSTTDRAEKAVEAAPAIPAAVQIAVPAVQADEPSGRPMQSPESTPESVESRSRYPLPAVPPTARAEPVAEDGTIDQAVRAREEKSLDMAAGIDTLKVRVREQVKENTAEKAVSQAPRPDEARLYDLPEAPVQARKGSITDFQPTIAKPKAIVRDEDSDLIVVPANGVRPSVGKAPRRLAAVRTTAAAASAALPEDGKVRAGQVESIRIPPKTNIPLPPGLFDEEELAELERRGYRVERPVVKARDDADELSDRKMKETADTQSAGKKSPDSPSKAAGKAAADTAEKTAAPEETPKKVVEKSDADGGGPPALSPSLFRNRKKQAEETAPADEVPGEVWEREPVTGFTPVRQARNLFNSILGR